MNIDEQLLNDQNRSNDATGSAPARAGALNEARRNGGENDSNGNQDNNQDNPPQTLREAAQADKAKKKKGLKGKVKAVAARAINNATNKLLQAAWKSLIESFGLTLIWINIHVFLGYVFGNEYFCKLGNEWVWVDVDPEKAKKRHSQRNMLRIAEPMGLACCDLGCLFIIIAAASLVAMLLGVISNPLEAIKNMLGGLWHALSGGK